MLINNHSIIGLPILSLHTGGRIATVSDLIIDPATLKVIAFFLEGPLVGGEHGDILKSTSVREYAKIGMIVDSVDEFVFSEDIVKLQEIIDLNFNIIGIKVVTKKGTKLGRVTSFVMDSSDFRIMQLIVRRPTFKALVDPELVIGRSQISEIDDRKIVVKNEEEKIRKDSIRKDFVPNFVNPFREPNFAPAQNQNPDEPDIE